MFVIVISLAVIVLSQFRFFREILSSVLWDVQGYVESFEANPWTPLLRDAIQVTDSRVVLDKMLAESGPILLGSNNGDWIGSDGDASIELRPDGTVLVSRFSFSVMEFSGRFTVDRYSRVILDLNDCPIRWPAMFVYSEGGTLLLAPGDSDPMPDSRQPWWPFRQVPADHRNLITKFPWKN
ncbi:MAG: hypothetical protein AB7O26_02110 [Planctomycetaceae bacterium]